MVKYVHNNPFISKRGDIFHPGLGRATRNWRHTSSGERLPFGITQKGKIYCNSIELNPLRRDLALFLHARDSPVLCNDSFVNNVSFRAAMQTERASRVTPARSLSSFLLYNILADTLSRHAPLDLIRTARICLY